MTELIQSQLKIMTIMLYCGLASGLIIDVFNLFSKRFFGERRIGEVVSKLSCSIVIAFMIGEFSFYCQNGKLTFTGSIMLMIGLLLWRKFFCDIIRR